MSNCSDGRSTHSTSTRRRERRGIYLVVGSLDERIIVIIKCFTFRDDGIAAEGNHRRYQSENREVTKALRTEKVRRHDAREQGDEKIQGEMEMRKEMRKGIR